MPDITTKSAEETASERWLELERADARRRGIEEAAKRIEQLDGNELYQKAWKAAVSAIRSLLILDVR